MILNKPGKVDLLEMILGRFLRGLPAAWPAPPSPFLSWSVSSRSRSEAWSGSWDIISLPIPQAWHQPWHIVDAYEAALCS